MESSGNFIVLLQARTAAQNLRQPKLANSTLHVANLALGGCWSPDPLRRLAANTTYQVGMSESLGSALLGLGVEARRNWLCDARVQRGSSAWDEHRIAILVAGQRAALTLAGAWPREARMSTERRSHGE